jgi:putative lipase involved disintegration of autophagic bodies
MIVHLCWAAVLCLAVTPSYASAAWSLPLSSPYALAAEWSSLVFDWMQQPAAPQGLSFRLDSAIHHSTHPDHLGKSAVYNYGNDARIAATAPAIGGLKTISQRVTRLRDPKAYLVQRERILSSSRLSMASGGPSTAISTLDSLHDLLEWEDVDLLAPDVTSRATLLALARMSSAAYEAPPEPPAWTPTDGFEKWNVSMSFGWIENGEWPSRGGRISLEERQAAASNQRRGCSTRRRVHKG